MTVKGFQLTVTVDLDFEAIKDALDLLGETKTVDELEDLWNDGLMEEFLGEYFEASDLVRIASDDGSCGDKYPIQVGSGYYN